MALIKGMLASFDNLLGPVPTIVLFQYNPTDVTRVFRSDSAGAAQAADGAALNAARPPIEDYTIKLELDATDALEHEGPLTLAFGISPRIAAIEMLMQPVGKSLFSDLSGALLGSRGATIPPAKLPLVLFVWGPSRVTPVRLNSLTIRETSFDELLNPIHASADLGFQVLRNSDLGDDDTLAQAAATFYQAARKVKAVLQLPQMAEFQMAEFS